MRGPTSFTRAEITLTLLLLRGGELATFYAVTTARSTQIGPIPCSL
jgi:hypothetical protein